MDQNYRTITARLIAEGWFVRRGSCHDIYKHRDRPGRIVVPRHRTLSLGVAREIVAALAEARQHGQCVALAIVRARKQLRLRA